MGGLVNMGPRTANPALYLFALDVWVKEFGRVGNGIYIAPKASQGHAAICCQRQQSLGEGPLPPLVLAVYEQRSSVCFPDWEEHQQRQQICPFQHTTLGPTKSNLRVRLNICAHLRSSADTLPPGIFRRHLNTLPRPNEIALLLPCPHLPLCAGGRCGQGSSAPRSSRPSHCSV